MAMMRESFLADMEIDMTPESTSSPYFTQEEIDAAIAAAPEYIFDPDRPLDPSNEAELNAYWSRGIVTVPGGHPHQDPLWRLHRALRAAVNLITANAIY
ncbi:hypothetical protein GTP45_18910 [Pseudoduganella sp. FT55W]|uniref:Uncharacterized protein n=1 Tax=Duganella rivi TaxID=2666083 RepID=A0A7X4GSL8_9BURK|nr:hypothetical protein [Duganella rivi]MYM68891.1 hypothetical protein [Duganella rivi]